MIDPLFMVGMPKATPITRCWQSNEEAAATLTLEKISLGIDAVDVARYWMGERQPTADINAF